MTYQPRAPRSPRFLLGLSGTILASVWILLATSLPASAQQIAGDVREISCLGMPSLCADGGEGPIHRAVAAAAMQMQTTAPSVAERGDGRFQLVLGAFITAAGTDIALTMYAIGKGSVRESGFGAWWQDSPLVFAATKSAISAIFAYQLQKLHKTRPKAALVLGLVDTAIEASLVARTARLSSGAR